MWMSLSLPLLKTNLRNALFSNSEQSLVPDYSYMKASHRKRKISSLPSGVQSAQTGGGNGVSLHHTLLPAVDVTLH